MTSRPAFGALSFAFLAVLLSSVSWAVEPLTENLSLSGYFRGTALVGPDGGVGKDLSETGDFELTLFDESYFELMLTYDYKKTARFYYQMALDNPNLLHLTGESTPVNLVVRDFYVEALDVGAPGGIFWVGSRKFRKIDEHNFFGAGYEFEPMFSLRAGLAHGVRKDFGYWGAKDAGVDATLTPNPASLRHWTILHADKQLGANSNLVGLLEHQFISKTRATYTSGATTYTFNLPAVQGYLAGLEYNQWGERWNNSAALVTTYGDAAGSGISKLNTRGSPLDIVDDSGTKSLSVTYYKAKNKRLAFTEAGAFYWPKYSVSYLSAFAYDWLATARNKRLFMLNGRPFYHLTEHVHLGADLARVWLSSAYARPGYTMLAPAIRYALGRDNYGKPQLMLFFANTFYDREIQIYRSASRYAATIGLQFELWF